MKPVPVRHLCSSQNHMATTFVFRVSCEERRIALATELLNEAHKIVARLELALSEFLPMSPVFQLNHAPAFTRVIMTREGIELLKRSEELRGLTKGSFDCAAKSSNKPQSGPAVAWNPETLEAWRLADGVHIGFGAIGKGYALDAVRVLLETRGFHDFLLSAGGSSIILSGFAAPHEPWTWGWSWQKDGSGAALGLALSHPTGQTIAIGVSGTHEKGEHLLDVREGAASGRSIQPGLRARSTLVALPSAADADALSTALFVGGYEEGARLMERLPHSAALAQIDSATIPAWNGIFHRLWGSLSTSASLTLLAAACVLTAPGAAQASNPKTELQKANEAVQAAAAALNAEPLSASSSVPNAAATPTSEDSAVDLGGMGLDSFTPYLTERNSWWALFPLSAVALVLVHLKKVRRNRMRNTAMSLFATTVSLWALLEQAHAVEIEPMGKALLAVLGTPKAFKKTVGDVSYYYSKNAAGKTDKVVFIQKNVWQKSCSHTWVVGVNKDGKITQIRAQEMQCPHAFPAKAASYLDQYKGKGPADLAKLSGEVTTIAKATGSCELATDAVKQSITTYQKIKGQL
jgi:thiamine biosynthesis lipoprotein